MFFKLITSKVLSVNVTASNLASINQRFAELRPILNDETAATKAENLIWDRGKTQVLEVGKLQNIHIKPENYEKKTSGIDLYEIRLSYFIIGFYTEGNFIFALRSQFS